jgi:hypothetical protein
MEICRLYAVVSLLFLLPGGAPLPFVPAGLILVSGTILGRGFSFVKRRRITEVLVYGAGCLISVFALLKLYGSLPFAGIGGPADWIEALGRVMVIQELYPFWFVVFCGGLFWFRGVRIGGGEISHSLTVNRYDIGLGILFGVYFLRIGLEEPDPLVLRLVGAYFLFSIIALFSARSWNRDENFMNPRSVAGLLFPFIAGFLIAAGAVVLLYPFLTRAAAETYVFLWENSASLRSLLIAFLRFLFSFGRRAGADAAPPAAAEADIPLPPEEMSPPGIPEKIIFWVFIVIAAAGGAVLIFWLVRAFIRYLAARKAPDDGGIGFFAALGKLLAAWARKIRLLRDALFRAAAEILARRKPLSQAGAEAFRKLCSWGRFSGLPRRACETPGEYAKRLRNRFPKLGESARILAEGVELELYGKRRLSGENLARLKAARRSLAGPALLASRIACRLGFRRH